MFDGYSRPTIHRVRVVFKQMHDIRQCIYSIKQWMLVLFYLIGITNKGFLAIFLLHWFDTVESIYRQQRRTHLGKAKKKKVI